MPAAETLPVPPDAVLFDLDGTIIDSRVPFALSVNHALTAHGRPERPPQELWAYLGPPTHETFAELLQSADGAPPDDALVHAVVATYRDHYLAHSGETTTVYEGLPELLAHLHGSVRLAVATSKVIDATLDLLDSLGLSDRFEAICGPAMTAVNEPKSVTVGQALAALAAGPQGPVRAPVMIGDRSYDVNGARERGVPTIGVLWGAGSEQELREAGAAALVREPAEVAALLGL